MARQKRTRTKRGQTHTDPCAAPEDQAINVTTVPEPSTSSDPPALTHDQIGQRAYLIWLVEGCPEGYSDEHWLRAEQELIRESDAEQ